MTWRETDPQGNEAAKIRWDLVEYTNGRGLDLGCGQFKAFPHFTGVDNGHHWGMKGVDVHVETCENLDLFANQSMDFVFSSHLLEHITNYKAALKEWLRVIKTDGYLILYVPDEDEYPKVGEKGANPDHKWNVNYDKVIEAMKEVGGWDLVDYQKRNQDREYSLFFVFKKLQGNKHRFSYLIPKPEKTCAICRYGAFGDLIQASSILPGLKKQGYHISLYTTKNGYEIVKNDPHIDKFIIQGQDQVPNQLLGEFWSNLKKKYDKFINLSESVEGSLLALQGRVIHSWPHEARHKMLNKNYMEMTHDIAEVPYEFNQKFYATDEEKKWANTEKAKIGGTVILWSLAGSAVHKTWPHLDIAIARIMLKHKDAKVVLIGDTLCQILEQGWENEPRVIRRSGVWTIRQSLAFAQVSDLVIGPETGVLNAVGMENVPKIIMLSHSSEENLTKHWKNTIVLTPKTDCHPCHLMHYNFEYCRKDEATGTAQCQADISPDIVDLSINQFLAKAA